MESTGRYIYDFDSEKSKEDKTFFDPEYCIIHLRPKVGTQVDMAWVFPKGKNKVNIGLGVQQKLFEKDKQRIRK